MNVAGKWKNGGLWGFTIVSVVVLFTIQNRTSTGILKSRKKRKKGKKGKKRVEENLNMGTIFLGVKVSLRAPGLFFSFPENGAGGGI